MVMRTSGAASSDRKRWRAHARNRRVYQGVGRRRAADSAGRGWCWRRGDVIRKTPVERVTRAMGVSNEAWSSQDERDTINGDFTCARRSAGAGGNGIGPELGTVLMVHPFVLKSKILVTSY